MKRPLRIALRIILILPILMIPAGDLFLLDFIRATRAMTPGSACYMIGDDYLATCDNLSITNGDYGMLSKNSI